MHRFESSLLAQIPTIAHAFGGVHEPIPSPWKDAWEITKPNWKQTHGTAIAEVLSKNQNCGEVDSLWTHQPELWIGVATADCVPILIAEKTGRAVAAIHAGWRGTLQKAAKAAVITLERKGYPSSDLIAAIGPSIRPCCFEVGREVLEQFMTEFPQIPEELLTPKPSHLDLAAVNFAILQGLGVSQIEILPYCSKCTRSPSGEALFHSYRREGTGTRQWSIISIQDHSSERSLNR